VIGLTQCLYLHRTT